MSDRHTMLNDLKKLVSYDTFEILSKETTPLKDIQRLYEYKMLEMKVIEESEQKTSISRFNELTGLDIQTGSTTFLFTLSDIQKIIALIDRKDRIIEEM